jgi:hypothetical protein
VSSARFRFPAGQPLDQWVEAWRADDPGAEQVEGTWQFAIPYARWSELAITPPADVEPEEVDLFRAQHSALGRLLGVSAQHVLIETVGHIGAPDVSFLFSVNGKRLGEAADPIPFAKDGSGATYPLVPCAFEVYSRLCGWNAKRSATRAEQIVFVGQLRNHLDRAAALLGDAAIPFTFELDPHLRQFQAHRAGRVALAWKPHKGGKVFDLQLDQVLEDGSRVPIDLKQLDPDSPLIMLSSTEHILLDRDTEAVARVAKTQANKLAKHVERHFHNPATVLPEGISLDNIDLSAYGPRVVGFAPILKAERFIDIRSSGTEWYQRDGQGPEPFLRLEIAQPAGGGGESLELATPEAAEQAIERLEKALEKDPPDVVSVGAKRVEPTRALVDRIKQDLSAFRARGEVGKEGGKKPPGDDLRSGRLAAVISEDTPVPIRAHDTSAAPEVPWDVLASQMASFKLKSHQLDGIQWMWGQYKQRESGVLLADDMGLGKTLQIAAFLALQRAVDPPAIRSPSLIVCPPILLSNWHDELRKFFKPEVFASLIVLYDDALRKRKRGGVLDVSDLRETDYVLTNYETLQAHQQALLTLDWNVVVLDEAQAIKNPETYRARAARGLKRKFGICSTGTPVENRLCDLWGLYDFLSPGHPFSTLKEFQKEYEDDLEVGI